MSLQQITIVSGPVASGKSAVATRLSERFGAPIVRTRELIKKRNPSRTKWDRTALQRAGDKLDRDTNGQWVADDLGKLAMSELADAEHVIIDGVRVESQVNAMRRAWGSRVKHIHLTAPIDVLEARYTAREDSSGNETLSYADVRKSRTERAVGKLAESADVVIDTDRCTVADVAVRAEAALRRSVLSAPQGYVDVLVGGQFGSEGKGQIVAHLAPEYDLLVRVGGPNAGHKVYEEPKPFSHHLLPSGTRTSQAQLLIGPGAVLGLQTLLEEIAACEVGPERLGIDCNALIIEREDVEAETKPSEGLVAGIGSTGQGVGYATARRITNRHPDRMPRRAQDIDELEPFLCDAVQRVSDAVESGKRVLLEGTQGTGLSLYHGEYPYVTSRDTTVAGCLAEAGIAPGNLRKVIMVCRTYPIRVQSPAEGTSGSMSKEISFEVIAERSGKDAAEMLEAERTTTTNRKRRVGEFDWNLLRRATVLNRPTDIALTFTDYLTASNSEAVRFDQLTEETIRFVEEIERVAEAPVTMIATGFNHRSVIDRRRW